MSKHTARALACLFSMAMSNMAIAEIRYIPLEEAEETRRCLLFTSKLEEATKDLRAASVAGGSALGKSNAEANGIRTKLKFEKRYFERMVDDNCTDEELAVEEPDDTLAQTPDQTPEGSTEIQPPATDNH